MFRRVACPVPFLKSRQPGFGCRFVLDGCTVQRELRSSSNEEEEDQNKQEQAWRGERLRTGFTTWTDHDLHISAKTDP